MSTQIDMQNIKGITQDSRNVKSGYLFAALQGERYDGQDYINDAVSNGAIAILAVEGTVLPVSAVKAGVKLITHAEPRRELALMAADFYGRQPSNIVAVTGTNGKTSVVHFTEQLWSSQGIKAVSFGTLSGAMTTPDPVALHKELSDMAGSGITHLALEASSHGLHQYRLDGVKIKASGFTNLSHDHLDYHGGMEEYLTSKIRLFSDLMEIGSVSVLNADSDEFEVLSDVSLKAGHTVLSYGFKGEDIKIIDIEPLSHGQRIKLNIFDKAFNIIFPLVGSFQVMNALCALGLVLAEDRSRLDEYVDALEKLQVVPGRLQEISGHPKGASIYVDYAHTPDALENVLKALRSYTNGNLANGNLICIFGCGGDRDEDKRPLMGEVANRLADEVIVTDDNPRTKNAKEIRSAILSNIPNALEIADRREAIKIAIRNLNIGDVLLIAGKGHEQGQVFADHTDPFDDVIEAEKVIRELVN